MVLASQFARSLQTQLQSAVQVQYVTLSSQLLLVRWFMHHCGASLPSCLMTSLVKILASLSNAIHWSSKLHIWRAVIPEMGGAIGALLWVVQLELLMWGAIYYQLWFMLPKIGTVYWSNVTTFWSRQSSFSLSSSSSPCCYFNTACN